MKKITIYLCCMVIAAMVYELPVWAMHEKSSEERIEELSTRIEELEKSASEKKEPLEWLNIFKFSGLLEVEAGYEKYNPDAAGEPTDESSDIVLATMELGVDAKLHEYVSGHVLFLWEEDETEPVDLDEGFITISAPDREPLYLTAGKHYVPFGNFESYFISDPLTLELGETNESAVMGGYHGDLLDINLGVFNGDINKAGEDDHAENAFASVTFTMPGDMVDHICLTSGVSYISNIADSDALSEEISDLDGNGESDDLKDYVGGISGYLTLHFQEKIFCMAEYVSALDDFNPGELTFGDDKLQPSAWNLELAYVPESQIGAGLKYEGSDDCDGFLPETSCGGIVFWYPFDQTYVGLEYLSQDFENDDNIQKVTAQLAFQF